MHKSSGAWVARQVDRRIGRSISRRCVQWSPCVVFINWIWYYILILYTFKSLGIWGFTEMGVRIFHCKPPVYGVPPFMETPISWRDYATVTISAAPCPRGPTKSKPERQRPSPAVGLLIINVMMCCQFHFTIFRVHLGKWPMYGWFMMILLKDMVIFHSYVKLPEGIYI